MRWLRIWLALAGINGVLSVAAGAFGAHALSDPQIKALIHTGSQYQAMHAVAALACFAAFRGSRPVVWMAGLFGVGGLVFGGSLYALAMTGVRLWGAVTPLGGLMLLAGWAVVFVAGARSVSS